MILVLLAQLSHAGSIGLYTDMSAGPQLTDYQIDVHVPSQFHLSTGVFRGNYTGTRRFGVYWRAGVAGRIKGAAFESDGIYRSYTEFSGELEFGRGVDLVQYGAWWTVAVGGSSFMVDRATRNSEGDLDFDYVYANPAASLRLTLGAVRSFGPNIGISLQGDIQGSAIPATGQLPLFIGVRLGLLLRAHRLDRESRESLRDKRREVREWRADRKERERQGASK